MTTLGGRFARQEQAEAVVAQLQAAHIDPATISITVARPAAGLLADGGVLVTVRDVPIDARDLVATILETADGRAPEETTPGGPDGAEQPTLPHRAATEAVNLTEEALAGATGALAGGIFGSLVAGPAGGLAGLVIGGASGAGGAHLEAEPATSTIGPAVGGAAGALAGAAFGTVAGPGGVVVGGLLGAAVGGALGEAMEDMLAGDGRRPAAPH
jgi:hypothetical protein